MNDAIDPEAVRARILERLAVLEAVEPGGGTDGDVVTLDQQRVGRLSRMDALQAQAMAGATDARRARERRRLRQALARIEAGTWGWWWVAMKRSLPGAGIDPAAGAASAVQAPRTATDRGRGSDMSLQEQEPIAARPQVRFATTSRVAIART